MDSFFFNITDTRYQTAKILEKGENTLQRVDISNGIVFFEGRLSQKEERFTIQNLDRMVMIIMVKKGKVFLEDHYTAQEYTIDAGKITLYCSSKQDLTFRLPKSEALEFFTLFIADFFLKRYLGGKKSEPVDHLYGILQKDYSLEMITSLPVDALSAYIVEKLLEICHAERMQSIRAEHRVIEFMIHRFGLLDIAGEGLTQEEITLASRAKAILLEDFVAPPTVEELAHLCATNTSKLKRVFKKVYGTTLYRYIQKLRLEEANLLLKEEKMSIGEIAKRVGYQHQGHFSKLFFTTYGIYPKALMRT